MQKRTRIRLQRRIAKPWQPRWEPEIKGWAFNHIAKNKWRLEHINDFEDLMQDAYMVFLKVVDTYPRVVDAPHFMSLYKTSLRNFLNDKAREYNRKLDLIDESFAFEGGPDVEDNIVQDINLGASYNDGTLVATLAGAPPELKLFMSFIRDDSNLAELRKPQREQRGQPRLNFDQRISKLLGIEYFPFRATLKSLFAN